MFRYRIDVTVENGDQLAALMDNLADAIVSEPFEDEDVKGALYDPASGAHRIGSYKWESA